MSKIGLFYISYLISVCSNSYTCLLVYTVPPYTVYLSIPCHPIPYLSIPCHPIPYLIFEARVVLGAGGGGVVPPMIESNCVAHVVQLMLVEGLREESRVREGGEEGEKG